MTRTSSRPNPSAAFEPFASRDGSASDPNKARIALIVNRLRLVSAPSRQMIVLLLAEGEQNVGAICECLANPSQPAVSHQLSLLRHGGLIECQRRGRNVFYALTESGRVVARVFDVLARSRAVASARG